MEVEGGDGDKRDEACNEPSKIKATLHSQIGCKWICVEKRSEERDMRGGIRLTNDSMLHIIVKIDFIYDRWLR